MPDCVGIFWLGLAIARMEGKNKSERGRIPPLMKAVSHEKIKRLKEICLSSVYTLNADSSIHRKYHTDFRTERDGRGRQREWCCLPGPGLELWHTAC